MPSASSFLLEEGIAFLNHGSFGACPRPVLEAQQLWRLRMEKEPVRFMVRELPQALGTAREAAAGLLGCDSDGLVFVDNATTGVNAVLRSLELEPGDELVTTDHVYGAVRNTMAWVAERSGARLVVADVPMDDLYPGVFAERLAQVLSQRTRLVVIDHITSPSGLVVDVHRVVALCRERGIPVLVDGAHAPGQLPLDLADLDADYYTGNLHKWAFAPRGTAVLHVRAPHRGAVHPTVISHGLGLGLHAEFDWTGTKDPTAWLAVPEALAFHAECGGTELMAKNHALAVEMGRMLAERWETTLPAPESMLGAMAAVLAPTRAPGTHDAAMALHDELFDVHHVEVPVVPFQGRLWVRISAQRYNQPAQYQQLAEALMPRSS